MMNRNLTLPNLEEAEHTEPDDETTRIISLRKALSYEQKHYEQYLKNRLD